MTASLRITLLQLDGSPLPGPILGMGRTGVVVEQDDDTALKLPLKYGTTGLSKAQVEHHSILTDISCESLQREKDVYKRLGQDHGIVSCLDLSGAGIKMALMKNGNLHDYMAQHHSAHSVQLAWFRDMARALVHIHHRRVIVADIATRNFLLDADLSVKFSDFTESTVLPLDTDMQAADDAGYSIYTDIGQMGTVIYGVVTGQRCEFDLFKDQPPGPATAAWPQRKDLPSTQNIWLGSIIEKCWTKGAYQNARDLLAALDLVVLE
ncbi:MAG: hypothetical protein M1837_006683 [Sclerophora amabilis]|nr:MAG: hypothetical protein M1837_006683 [Sclerophora amabilis]